MSEATKGANIRRKSKKGRQYNGQKKTNDDPQNSTQKTKDRATRSPLKIKSGALEV